MAVFSPVDTIINYDPPPHGAKNKAVLPGTLQSCQGFSHHWLNRKIPSCRDCQSYVKEMSQVCLSGRGSGLQGLGQESSQLDVGSRTIVQAVEQEE